jgi:transcriptional regulator GlxA family with amidase domain
VPIVAFTAAGPGSSSDILAMAQAGVHELIIQGFDDAGIALRTVAESASRRCAATRVLSELESDVPADALPFVRFCLERSSVKLTVTDAATYLGVHRKTLVYRLARTTLPPPSTMIGWCRLFVAAHMLEDPRRSVASVALALDFSSGAALRGMLRRYTGLRPQELRECGGLALLISTFRRQIARRAQLSG